MTLKGRITDLQPQEMSIGGNPKKIFNIVDHAGYYITCCAMKHNVDTQALQNFREVVLYYATGRSAIGTARGMVYLLRDAMIIPIGEKSLLSTAKTEPLEINLA